MKWGCLIRLNNYLFAEKYEDQGSTACIEDPSYLRKNSNYISSRSAQAQPGSTQQQTYLETYLRRSKKGGF